MSGYQNNHFTSVLGTVIDTVPTIGDHVQVDDPNPILIGATLARHPQINNTYIESWPVNMFISCHLIIWKSCSYVLFSIDSSGKLKESGLLHIPSLFP